MSPFGASGSFHLIRQERERTFVTFGLAGREGAIKKYRNVSCKQVSSIDDY